MPTSASVHVDAALSNVSIQYKNAALIADRILPIVMVNKRSDKFFKYTKGERFRRLNTLVGPKSKAQEVDWTVTTDNYSVEDHALQDFISYTDIANADAPLDLLADTTEWLTELLMLDYEKAVADLVFASGTYDSTNKATPGTKWGNAAATPIKDVITGINAIVGVNPPYCCAFGNKAWELFRQHPDVLAAIQPTSQQVIATQQQVAAFFGFEEVLVGDAWVNTASRGATDSYSRIWGDHVLIFKRASGLRVREVALGYTFQFGQREVIRWEDLSIGPKGGEYIKTSWTYDLKNVATDAAYLLHDVDA